MTTAIIHGDPGSYKTATLINDYLVPAIKQGRVVVTNIRGVKPVDDIAELYGFDLPDTAQIINVSFDSDGFEKMARFFHWAPHGALILMDEGQRIYPTRLRNFNAYDYLLPDEARPKTVEDAFDSHRHMNWDIYISTTNIGKMHKEIRAVAEFGYRHKNLASVFKFLKGRYKRVSHNAENSGNAIGHTISSTFRKIDTRCFDAYQSTATGQTKDTSSSISFFKQPRVLLLLAIVIWSTYNMGSMLFSNGGLPSMFGGDRKASSSQSSSSSPSVYSQTPPSVPNGSTNQRDNPAFVSSVESVIPKRMYYSGSINNDVILEMDFDGSGYVNIRGADLRELGYLVVYRSNAFVRLTHNNTMITVFPRPKSYAGFTDPTVLNDPTNQIF